MPHRLITDSTLNDRALLLYLVLCDQQRASNAFVRLTQPQLAICAGWRRGKVCTGVRRVQRALDDLSKAKLITVATSGTGRYTLTRYRPRIVREEAAFEQVPRAVLDVLITHKDNDKLLRHWLLWRMEACKDTGKAWTDMDVSAFAYKHGVKIGTVIRRRKDLVELGLLLTHTSADGTVVVRFPHDICTPTSKPSPTKNAPVSTPMEELPVVAVDSAVESTSDDQAACPSVTIEPRGALAEVSLLDSPSCHTFTRPPLHQALNQEVRAETADTNGEALGAADKPPTTRKDIKVEAAAAAERILQESPQLRALDPKTRGKLRQGIAKTWRRWSDRPVEATIATVIAALDLAEHTGQLHKNHILVIREALSRWDSERLAPTQPEHVDSRSLATGPSLDDLAETQLPASGAVDDLQLAFTTLQTTLARQVLDITAGHSINDLESALRHARLALAGQVPDQHRSMLVLAAAKVRTACHVTAQDHTTQQPHDDQPEMSLEEALAAAQASLAEASRRACAVPGLLVDGQLVAA